VKVWYERLRVDQVYSWGDTEENIIVEGEGLDRGKQDIRTGPKRLRSDLF
jgi:hypothetical protein